MADTQFCSVGSQAPLGTERFRIYNGAVLFDGTTGATPTSGAGTRLMWCPAKAAFRAGIVSGTQWDDAGVGSYSVAFGDDTKASGSYSGVWGGANTASGIGATACGVGSSAALRGQMAVASNQFSAAGDAQRSNLCLMRSSSDATAVELTLDGGAPGAGTRLTIASGKLYRFRIELSCTCTASGGTLAGQVATWEFTGAIKNKGGTTTLVSCNAKFDGDSDMTALSAVVSADDANDCLALTCTGTAVGTPNTFHWHAAVYLSEVA